MTTSKLDMQDAARRIVTALHENGFPPDGGVRQFHALAEEAGEFVGAYRRWRGWARRKGTFEDMAAELADVLITAHVTAVEEDLPLTGVRMPSLVSPLVLFRAASDFLHRAQWGLDSEHDRVLAGYELDTVIHICHRVALTLDIDLNEAVRLKLEKIFTRGWNES